VKWGLPYFSLFIYLLGWEEEEEEIQRGSGQMMKTTLMFVYLLNSHIAQDDLELKIFLPSLLKC